MSSAHNWSLFSNLRHLLRSSQLVACWPCYCMTCCSLHTYFSGARGRFVFCIPRLRANHIRILVPYFTYLRIWVTIHAKGMFWLAVAHCVRLTKSFIQYYSTSVHIWVRNFANWKVHTTQCKSPTLSVAQAKPLTHIRNYISFEGERRTCANMDVYITRVNNRVANAGRNNVSQTKWIECDANRGVIYTCIWVRGFA